MRHGLRGRMVAFGGALAVAGLLAGCSGSGAAAPTATHPRHHHRAPSSPSTTPAGAATTPSASPSSAPPSSSPPATAAPLQFSPRSNGKHSHTCVEVTGNDPAQFVYYPVMVKATSGAVTLAKVATTYADGVQNAGAWVAPSPSDGGTGMVGGWPAPSILTQSNTVQWSRRVPAAGATIDPATGWYNVFLHLTVYPDALPLATDGLVFTYQDGEGTHSVTWVDHVRFASSC